MNDVVGGCLELGVYEVVGGDSVAVLPFTTVALTVVTSAVKDVPENPFSTFSVGSQEVTIACVTNCPVNYLLLHISPSSLLCSSSSLQRLQLWLIFRTSSR